MRSLRGLVDHRRRNDAIPPTETRRAGEYVCPAPSPCAPAPPSPPSHGTSAHNRIHGTTPLGQWSTPIPAFAPPTTSSRSPSEAISHTPRPSPLLGGGAVTQKEDARDHPAPLDTVSPETLPTDAPIAGDTRPYVSVVIHTGCCCECQQRGCNPLHRLPPPPSSPQPAQLSPPPILGVSVPVAEYPIGMDGSPFDAASGHRCGGSPPENGAGAVGEGEEGSGGAGLLAPSTLDDGVTKPSAETVEHPKVSATETKAGAVKWKTWLEGESGVWHRVVLPPPVDFLHPRFRCHSRGHRRRHHHRRCLHRHRCHHRRRYLRMRCSKTGLTASPYRKRCAI